MNDAPLMNRRRLLKLLAGTVAAGSLPSSEVEAGLLETLGSSNNTANIPGQLLGASAKIGHRLREPWQQKIPEQTASARVIIVGGGIAGLSAAWWLQRAGFHDFVLLELEADTGGNARSGSNTISAYPWGAHYLPLPGEDAEYVRMLLEELGVIHGYDAQQRPIYDEYALCAAPHERLRVRGQWQDSLVPQLGLSIDDQQQYDAFHAAMEHYRNLRGNDGKPAFTIPLALSSQDPPLLALDRISMAQYLEQQGWTAAGLRWYVDYCCRDDYGADASRVSAWAGIHYFAARQGLAANADPQTVLTWPEGNGWLSAQLRNRLAKHIHTRQLAARVTASDNAVTVDCLDTTTQQHTRWQAEHVILATPRFIAQHLLGNPGASQWLPDYAPWLVANISLRDKPATAHSAMAWDNVMMESRSLGYIHAGHQSLAQQARDTVITWYEPLDFDAPAKARQWALQAGHERLAQRVLDDLLRMHPDIQPKIQQIDTWLWGHAMAIPAPDTVWHRDKRLSLPAQQGRLHFANSDMSGLSLFEEAQYHGVQAARAVLEQTDKLPQVRV